MKVYAYDHNGFYMCPTTAQKDPMQPGKFLMPAHATDVEPMTAPEGQCAKWDGKAWSLAEHPAVTLEKARAARAAEEQKRVEDESAERQAELDDKNAKERAEEEAKIAESKATSSKKTSK